MPKPSPSPPVTMTFSSWLASCAPVATASARPCSVCMPYVLMKPGKLDEQPMPLMVDHVVIRDLQLGDRLLQRVQHAEVAAAGAPVGVDLALEVGHRQTLGQSARSVAIFRFSLDHDFVHWHVQSGLCRPAVLHGFHDVVRHERFAIVLADVPRRQSSSRSAGSAQTGRCSCSRR